MQIKCPYSIKSVDIIGGQCLSRQIAFVNAVFDKKYYKIGCVCIVLPNLLYTQRPNKTFNKRPMPTVSVCLHVLMNKKMDKTPWNWDCNYLDNFAAKPERMIWQWVRFDNDTVPWWWPYLDIHHIFNTTSVKLKYFDPIFCMNHHTAFTKQEQETILISLLWLLLIVN